MPVWSQFDARVCLSMAILTDRTETLSERHELRFFSAAQVDQILREGGKRGRTGSHAAIERILRHEPTLERAELWRRLRQIKYPARNKPFQRAVWSENDDQILLTGYGDGRSGKQKAIRELLAAHADWRPHIIWKRAATLGLAKPSSSRPSSGRAWSESEDDILLELAGYKDVRVIGKRLHRSADAVRSRLRILGKSTRFQKEGYSQRALAKELHLGNGTIRRLAVEQILEFRDPRITQDSLTRLRKSGTLALYATDETHSSPTPSMEAGSSRPSRAQRVWAETARELGITLQTIDSLIARGRLKVYDARITEKSVRRFCHKYGSLVNYELLNSETREWLRSTMDFVQHAGRTVAQRLESHRKHARVVRKCQCGREVRGNAFFRHTRTCGGMTNGSIATHQRTNQTGATLASQKLPDPQCVNRAAL
jgi:hypothetical protein